MTFTGHVTRSAPAPRDRAPDAPSAALQGQRRRNAPAGWQATGGVLVGAGAGAGPAPAPPSQQRLAAVDGQDGAGDVRVGHQEQRRGGHLLGRPVAPEGLSSNARPPRDARHAESRATVRAPGAGLPYRRRARCDPVRLVGPVRRGGRRPHHRRGTQRAALPPHGRRDPPRRRGHDLRGPVPLRFPYRSSWTSTSGPGACTLSARPRKPPEPPAPRRRRTGGRDP